MLDSVLGPSINEGRSQDIAQVGQYTQQQIEKAQLSDKGSFDHRHLVKLPVIKDKRTLFIDFHEVVTIQVDAHYSTVHTQNEEYLCTLPLSQLEEKLISQDFIRVHRSHIVNVRHIRAFEREDDHAFVIMACRGGEDRRIPVSRSKVAALKNVLGI